MVFPRKIHERWIEEYKAFKTRLERDNWVAQRIEERNAINAVWVMKWFKNSTNPLLCLSMPNFAKTGQSL